MKSKTIQFYKAILLGFICHIFILSCKKSDETNPKTDFSKYVSFGNSLTAGVSAGGLYNESIQNAYPNLIAKQMKMVGGGEFPQAYFAAGQENGTGYLKLNGYNGLLPNIVQETTKLAIISVSPQKLAKYGGANQNLGIPSIKMADVDNQSFRNIFTDRLSPEGTQKSYLSMIEEAKPTFFTCWLGSNDVLDFAGSGGTRPLTDKTIFATNLKKILDALVKNGAKGIIANIGDIVSVPSISLLSQYKPLFNTGKLFITTKDGVREWTSKDFLLLPSNINGLDVNALSKKGTTISDPWLDREVLDENEVIQAQKATSAFNELIKQEAASHNIAFLDAASFFQKLLKGVSENGETVDASFLTGGIFSLDGAHLTPKGNAYTANEYIKAINGYYKTNIPLLDTKTYVGVK